MFWALLLFIVVTNLTKPTDSIFRPRSLGMENISHKKARLPVFVPNRSYAIRLMPNLKRQEKVNLVLGQHNFPVICNIYRQ